MSNFPAGRLVGPLHFASALALVVGALAGCGPAAPDAVVSPPTPASTADDAATSHTLRLAADDFRRYALNALLVPLLDDDTPPRWSDPLLATDCLRVVVTVDGAPLVPGALVPARAFILVWTMDRCMPFGSALELSGKVELLVFHDGLGYSAIVQPQGLRLATSAGSQAFAERFVTSTPLQLESPPLSPLRQTPAARKPLDPRRAPTGGPDVTATARPPRIARF
jgi:hypothetical protein